METVSEARADGMRIAPTDMSLPVPGPSGATCTVSSSAWHDHRRQSDLSSLSEHDDEDDSRPNSWVSDNQPIPWDSRQNASAGPSASLSSVAWRITNTTTSSHHLSASSIADTVRIHSRSASIVSTCVEAGPSSRSRVSMEAGPSRSRVSMDALPAPTASDDSGATTPSPSSSTASLPTMEFDEPPSRPNGIPAARQPAGPVGLGLSPAILETAAASRPRWTEVHDIADEIDSDNETDNDHHEMESYMASHRAPVDAALRSMPGVVGLGDGWAGGPQPKQKRKWFSRPAKPSTPTEQDPLALWAHGEGSVAEPLQNETSPKKWRSRMFSASQRVLPMSSSTTAAGESSKTPPPVASRRGILGRSRLNFGSMVDLGRSPDKNRDRENNNTPKDPAGAAEATTPVTPCSFTTPTPSSAGTPLPTKRHSMATLRRKPPPHPLELTHGSKASAATRSQPAVLTASSSQPSFSASSTASLHPILRQAYARSESNLAGTAMSDGSRPRPAPLIIDSRAFVNTAPMPTWRPPMMSPTPLLNVQEEDEEDAEAGTPESTERPQLKRSATFGDDEELPSERKASAAPALTPVAASPRETERALSIRTTPSTAAAGNANRNQPSPTPSLLGRLKNALTRGKGRSSKMHNGNGSPLVPNSPRSFHSEQQSVSPSVASTNGPQSMGRGMRPRSRLFGRMRRDAGESTFDLSKLRRPSAPEAQQGLRRPSAPEARHDLRRPSAPESQASPTPARKGSQPTQLVPPQPHNPPKSADKDSYRVSRHVVQSMINLAPRSDSTFGTASGHDLDLPAASIGRSTRRSWAPTVLDDDDDIADGSTRERRGSRVSLRRFKSPAKQRPSLGSVFPRPPESVQQPPSLHWAFPASGSTPALYKLGGSTLSLALDISADGNEMAGLHDIAESPSPTPLDQPGGNSEDARERALASTFAALNGKPGARSPHGVPHMVRLRDGVASTTSLLRPKDSGKDDEDRAAREKITGDSLHRRSVPLNLRSVPINLCNLTSASRDNLASSTDSLGMPNIVDFPLPPSSSSGDVSSPDPDQVEQLCTPRDAGQYPIIPGDADYYAGRLSDESTSGASTSTHPPLHKQRSWSTCKTALATPTSATTPIAITTDAAGAKQFAPQRHGSFTSLITAESVSVSDDHASDGHAAHAAPVAPGRPAPTHAHKHDARASATQSILAAAKRSSLTLDQQPRSIVV